MNDLFEFLENLGYAVIGAVVGCALTLGFMYSLGYTLKWFTC